MFKKTNSHNCEMSKIGVRWSTLCYNLMHYKNKQMCQQRKIKKAQTKLICNNESFELKKCQYYNTTMTGKYRARQRNITRT